MSNKYCSRCGHPEGCVRHNANFMRHRNSNEPKCSNCGRCKDPIPFAVMEVYRLQKERKQVSG